MRHTIPLLPLRPGFLSSKSLLCLLSVRDDRNSFLISTLFTPKNLSQWHFESHTRDVFSGFAARPSTTELHPQPVFVLRVLFYFLNCIFPLI